MDGVTTIGVLADGVMTIRLVAGVLAVILLGVVIARRKKMASARRVTPKR